MDKKLKEKIINSNKSIWQAENYSKIAMKGLYEVYFLIFYNEIRKEAYWIRYTLLCNKNSKKDTLNLAENSKGGGLLWLGYFNTDDPKKNFMVKKHYSLDEVEGTYKKEDDFIFITIDKSFLSLNNVSGGFSTKSNKLFSWNLQLTDFQLPYEAVPKLAKQLKISNTMNKATHPHIKVSGMVNLNGEQIVLDNCDAIQYHTYADGYKVPWEWFNVYTISKWSNGFIDFSYKVNKGILEVFDGKTRYTSWNKNILGKLLTSRNLKREKSVSSVEFSLEKKTIQIYGTVNVEEKNLIGVEYVGPTGEKFYCYNSEVADCSIKIVDLKNKHKENKTMDYSVQGSVAFETTYDSPVEGLNYMPWDEEEYFH